MDHCFLIFGLFISSCAQLQNEGSNPQANQSEAQTSQSVSGGFHPGVFIRNRVNDVKGFIAEAAKNPHSEDAQNLEQSPTIIKELDPIEKKVEDKPRDVVGKGGPPNSIVHIKAGTYKIKYEVVASKKKNKDKPT